MSENTTTATTAQAEAVVEETTTTQPETKPEIKEFKFKPVPRLMAPSQTPAMVKSAHGVTAVFGHELIGSKLMAIIQNCLNLPMFESTDMDHGVRMAICRTDGYPYHKGAPALGAATPDTFSISLNLLNIFGSAVEACIDMPEFSILAVLHNRFIGTFLHELHHCHMFSTDEAARKAFYSNDEKYLAELEVEADKFAETALIEMAKTSNLEPDHITKAPFFANQMFEMFKHGIGSEFVKKQAFMVEQGILFEKPETEGYHGYKLFNYKDIVHRMSGEPLDDPSWNPQAGGVNPTLLEQLKLVPQNQPENAVVEMAKAAADNGNCNNINLDEAIAEDYDVYANELYQAAGQTWSTAQAPAPTQPVTAWTPQAPPAATAQDAYVPASTQMPPFSPATAPSPSPAPAYGQANSNLPDHGLTGAQVRDITFGVYNKIVNHIWTRCGLPQVFPIQNFQGLGNNVVNVVHCVTEPIQLTQEEATVIVAFDRLNPETGKWEMAVPTTGGLLMGFVGKSAQIPIYKLHINSGRGIETLRLVMPQNPTNQSKSGDEARSGVRIVFVMDGADRGDNGKGRFLWRNTNGAWTKCGR